MFINFGKVELLNVLVKLSNSELTLRACPLQKSWLVLDGDQLSGIKFYGGTPLGSLGPQQDTTDQDSAQTTPPSLLNNITSCDDLQGPTPIASVGDSIGVCDKLLQDQQANIPEPDRGEILVDARGIHIFKGTLEVESIANGTLAQVTLSNAQVLVAKQG